MYRTFTSDGKEYRLEYSLEAYMTKYVDEKGNYKTHVAPLVDYIANLNSDGGEPSSAFDIPEIAAHAVYAGLLRWHGRGKRGDKTIVTFDDACELCMSLIEENPEDKYLGTWSGLMMMSIEQMEADGFFTHLAAPEPQDKKPKSKK